MNAVFEPSLLFMTDEDACDENKVATFVEQLTQHLSMMEEYKLAHFFWTDELEQLLWSPPQMQPWMSNYMWNALKIFHNLTEIIEEDANICQITPQLHILYSNFDAHQCFLKLIHQLINLQENFYLCLGVPNKLAFPQQYRFYCHCHANQLMPELLNTANDWLKYINVSEMFFPKNIDEFDANFEKGLTVIRQKNFNNKEILFDFEFSKNFKKSIINRRTFKEEIFIAIVKKLISTSAESAKSDLEDEFITKNKINEWRIRVTQRPSSTRIHYIIDKNGKIIFLHYYGEGEHDDGL